MTNKGCNIFAHSAILYIVPSWKTIPGFWIAAEPVLQLPQDNSPRSIGEAVLQALSSSRCDVPVPSDLKQPNPVIASAGLKSWKVFAQTALSVRVEFDGVTVRITPTAKDRRGAFLYEPEKEVPCAPEPTRIGETVIAQLAKSS